MHAVLLTLIVLGGDAVATGRITQSSADFYRASPASYTATRTGYLATTGHGGGVEQGASGGSCDTCGGGGGKAGGGHFSGNHLGGWFGHMPQTCYDPRYGCYYGGGRHMHRYPAFHGTFYRQPYNYRNVFDYPWHAEMHEPTSHFSYNVTGEQQQTAPGIQAEPIRTTPTPPTPPAPEPEMFDARYAPIGSGVVATQRRDVTDPRTGASAKLRR